MNLKQIYLQALWFKANGHEIFVHQGQSPVPHKDPETGRTGWMVRGMWYHTYSDWSTMTQIYGPFSTWESARRALDTRVARRNVLERFLEERDMQRQQEAEFDAAAAAEIPF